MICASRPVPRRAYALGSPGVTGRVGAAIACALVILAGCSGDPESGAPPTTTNPPSTPSVGASPSAGQSSQPSVTEPSAVATTIPPTVQSTADRSEAPPAELVQVVRIGVSDADADGAERIVIDTVGGTPGYRLRYVDAVRIDGEPVLLDGAAFLELVLQSADPDGDQGLTDDVAVDLIPDQPLIKQVQWVYYLGDELTYAISLGEVVPFSVTTTPNQIVITFSR